jgi:hypothetical protein
MTDEIRLQRSLMAALHAVALALLGLHLYVRTLPPTPTPIPTPQDAESAWWGLWPVTYVPGWTVSLGTLAMLMMIAWAWWREMRMPSTVPSVAAEPVAAPRWRSRVPVLISALLVLAFFAFPIVHTRWGDAYMIARAMAWPDAALRLTHSWQAPLDVFLHSRVWLALHAQQGWVKDAAPVYRILSPLAGALFLGVVLALTRLRWLAPGWLTYGLLVSLGLLQLFFGYVENYSFAAVGILAYLWLALRALAGVTPLWGAATLLALTNATHPSTVVLAPSLLLVAWIVGKRGNKSWPAVVLEVAVPMVLVATATVALMEMGGHGVSALLTTDRPGGGDARWLVPLFETTTRWEQYTMFSRDHVRDWLNQQLLVAPVVLPGLAVMGAYAALSRSKTQISQSLQSPISKTETPSHALPSSIPFLTTAALFYLLFTFLWNPDYGGQRDWDLFSLASLPTTLLLVAVAPRLLHGPRLLWGMAPLILLQALHTATWIYQNTLPWNWP